jgi:hypothetical protein
MATSSMMDTNMLGAFLFGPKFETFKQVLFGKMKEGGVDVSESDFQGYVENCVIDMSASIVHMFQNPANPLVDRLRGAAQQQEEARKEAPKEQVKQVAPRSDKCAFVLTRGPNKGNRCGKPCASGESHCSTHAKNVVEKKEEKVKKSEDKVVDSEGEEAQRKEQPKEAAKEAAKEEKVVKCSHLMSKGPRSGEKCGVVVKGDGDKCATHSKVVVKQKKEVVPAPKSPIQKAPEAAAKGPVCKAVLRRCKDRDMLYHQETGFVFKSKSDLAVIGRIDIVNKKPSGEMRALSHKDVEEIESMDGELRFKIDEQSLPNAGKVVAAAAAADDSVSDIENVLNDLVNGDGEEAEEEEAEEEAEEEEAEEDYFDEE